MEPLHMIFALLGLACTTALFALKLLRKSTVFPPCPPGSWPLLGHLPFLATGCPHHLLSQLARSLPPSGLGPIIGLRLGSKLAVVVCNSHLAKDVLHTHDKLLANRPHFLVTDLVFYGFDTSIAFTTYNPRWAMLRKLCTLELFSPKRLQDLQHLRYQEVRNLLRSLLQNSRHGTHAVDLGEAFCLMLCDTLGRVLHSKTLAEAGGHAFPSMLKEQEKLVAPTIGDFLPWLKFLDLPQKWKMKKYHDRVDKLIETMVSQRRQLMRSCKADELPKDLLQVLLSREATNHKRLGDQDELLTIKEIKGTILDVLSAGTHTTALTLEWAMAELLRNPHCLQKLRDEIDDAVGKGADHFVTDEDIPKLPYLEKVVKEVFRLHPSIPLLVPHVASDAVKLERYTLPAGTVVFVNVWAIGRDPDVWENAEEFLPERFDDKDGMDVRGQHYDLLPFGSGRRVCPGLRLALSVLHVTLANLVRTFEWQLPNGQRHMDLDMSEQRGISSMRMTPLLAIPKPRLAP